MLMLYLVAEQSAVCIALRLSVLFTFAPSHALTVLNSLNRRRLLLQSQRHKSHSRMCTAEDDANHC